MKITLRFFASVREALGTDMEIMQTQATTAADLRRELVARGGIWAQTLDTQRTLRVAVDQHIGPESRPLHDGAEVAFFPPVTGG